MTTLNLQVAAGADDGICMQSVVYDYHTWDVIGYASGIIETWNRFTGVSGLSGMTIDSAILQHYGNDSVGSPLTKVYAEDASAPAAPTDATDFNNKVRTTAGVDWDGVLTNDVWNSKNITPVIQELADSYDPSVIQILHEDDGSGGADAFQASRSCDYDSSLAAKLDIDYSASGPVTELSIFGRPYGQLGQRQMMQLLAT